MLPYGVCLKQPLTTKSSSWLARAALSLRLMELLLLTGEGVKAGYWRRCTRVLLTGVTRQPGKAAHLGEGKL